MRAVDARCTVGAGETADTCIRCTRTCACTWHMCVLVFTRVGGVQAITKLSACHVPQAKYRKPSTASQVLSIPTDLRLLQPLDLGTIGELRLRGGKQALESRLV